MLIRTGPCLPKPITSLLLCDLDPHVSATAYSQTATIPRTIFGRKVGNSSVVATQNQSKVRCKYIYEPLASNVLCYVINSIAFAYVTFIFYHLSIYNYCF